MMLPAVMHRYLQNFDKTTTGTYSQTPKKVLLPQCYNAEVAMAQAGVTARIAKHDRTHVS